MEEVQSQRLPLSNRTTHSTTASPLPYSPHRGARGLGWKTLSPGGWKKEGDSLIGTDKTQGVKPRLPLSAFGHGVCLLDR